jgi:hypothetical protein
MPMAQTLSDIGPRPGPSAATTVVERPVTTAPVMTRVERPEPVQSRGARKDPEVAVLPYLGVAMVAAMLLVLLWLLARS